MRQNYPLHIFLFLLTVFTTMMAGTELVTGGSLFLGNDPVGMWEIWRGIPFSFAFLLFLSVHEFGHYFTAVYHKVKCSLPYYIPMFLPFSSFNIGSFGAVIRIREVPSSRRKYFDIGIAGPLAGFVIALGLVLFGFWTLPPMEATVLEIHPGYINDFGGVPSEAQMAGNPGAMTFGGSLLFEGIRWLFHNDPNLPPSFEMMHYPWIMAGFLGMFFTALNLLPIGQLDGGHVVYGLLGARRAGRIARVAVVVLLLYGGMGIFGLDAWEVPKGEPPLEWISWVACTRLLYLGLLFATIQRSFQQLGLPRQVILVAGIAVLQFAVGLIFPAFSGNFIWVIYAFLTTRLVGPDHPVAIDDTPLSGRQKLLGVLAILIFILCFSPFPFSLG